MRDIQAPCRAFPAAFSPPPSPTPLLVAFVLVFDDSHWELYPSPSTPTSSALAYSNKPHAATMSRNVRQKYPPSAPARKQAAKRRDSTTSSSSLDLSDDGGYSAVEDLSESDEDDDEHIIMSEEKHLRILQMHRPEDLDPDADNDADDDRDDDEEEEDEEDEAEGDIALEEASWDGIVTEDEVEPESHFELEMQARAERHVRFTGVPDSDSDSTTSENSEDRNEEFFPDIFVDQSRLDARFRREIEYDGHDGHFPSDVSWDELAIDHAQRLADLSSGEDDQAYHDADMAASATMATPTPSQPPSPAVSPPVDEAELDGYESKFWAVCAARHPVLT